MRLIMVTVLLLPVLQTGAQSLKLSAKVKSPTAITYSPDNKYLVVASGKEAELYSPGSETKVTEFTGGPGKQGHSKDIISLNCSGDNTLLVTGSNDGTAKIWKLQGGELAGTLSGHTGPVVSAKFLDGSKYVVTASADMTVRLWDAQTFKEIYNKKDHLKGIRALDVSPDGKWIATGGGDKDIFLRDAQTGEVKQRLKGHNDWVRSLAFAPDSKTLASAGDDKVILIWDVESGKSIKQFPQRGWTYDLKFSGDAKYLAAALEKYAIEVYEVQTGYTTLKLTDFDNPVRAVAFSPNGKELTSIEEVSQVVKYWNIETLNISPVFRFRDKKDVNPPQIMVSNPPNISESKIRYSKDIIDINGTVIDESGVRRLRINGIETPIRSNGNFVIKLPLSMGDNFVNIEATDVNDNIALKKFIISRQDLLGGDYDPAKARNYLLVVGINNYEYWPHLSNAVKDANDLAGTLMGMYNFDFSDVTVLRDEAATRNNIYKTLRSYIERVTPSDNLTIYFSGHGHFDELLNEGYWIPVEAHLNAEGEYLPNSSILKIIENVNSQHTFLVADACFSGSLFGEQKRGYAENVEKYKSRWGLASGRLETVSDGAVGTNSPFATELLKYLKNNQKQKITVSEIIQAVKLSVAEHAEQTPIGNPLKVSGDEGGEFVLYKKK
jgi:hypothetical protein